MIIGLGTDILETARMARGMQSQRFCSKIFTEGELMYCSNKPLESAAGLFAAKEAAVKAIGTGFTGFWPCDVEIIHDANEKPMVHPLGVFKEICDSKQVIFQISISHTKDFVIAAAVAERDTYESRFKPANAKYRSGSRRRNRAAHFNYDGKRGN